MTELLGYFPAFWFDLSENNSKDREEVAVVSSWSSDCCCDSAQQETKESSLKSFVEFIQILVYGQYEFSFLYFALIKAQVCFDKCVFDPTMLPLFFWTANSNTDGLCVWYPDVAMATKSLDAKKKTFCWKHLRRHLSLWQHILKCPLLIFYLQSDISVYFV